MVLYVSNTFSPFFSDQVGTVIDWEGGEIPPFLQ